MNTYFDNNELDIDDFNKKFEEIQKNQETTGKEDEDKKLNNFKNNSKKKKFKDMTLIELITKNYDPGNCVRHLKDVLFYMQNTTTQIVLEYHS